MTKHFRTAAGVTLALLLGAGTGLAQGAAQGDAQGAALTFDMIVGGATIGQAGMTLTRTPEGTTSNGFANVTGTLDLHDVLETGPNGAATSYHLTGAVQGTNVTIDVKFGASSAEMTIEQGGKSQSVTLPLPGPVYVLDNNFIDGFQILADEVLKSGAAGTFDIIVPQVAMFGSAALGAPAAASVTVGGQETPAQRLDGVLKAGPQSIDFSLYLDASGNILVLTTSQNVRMERASAAQAPAPATTAVPEALATAAACLVERDVSITSTGATLVGKLTLPKAAADGSEGPAPTLVLIAGSGAVDLDGNAPPLLTNSGYKQLAYALACQGYGVLRASKLGISPSTGDGNAVTLDTYAQNTADWLGFLATQPGVDAARLGIIGHSEGGLVALYATAHGKVAPQALVLLASPGRPLDVLLREQLLARAQEGGATTEALATLGQQIDELIAAVNASTGVALTPTPELEKFPLTGMFAPAAGLLRSEFGVEPSDLARAVAVPVAVLQGEKDIQVTTGDAELIAAAAPHADLFLFADLTHNLVDTAGPALGMPLPGADAVISPTVVQVIATYLAGNLRARGANSPR